MSRVELRIDLHELDIFVAFEKMNVSTKMCDNLLKTRHVTNNKLLSLSILVTKTIHLCSVAMAADSDVTRLRLRY